jgi:hypothetical protein
LNTETWGEIDRREERKSRRISRASQTWESSGSFWDRCTKDKPSDWIGRLAGLQASRLAELRELGIRAIGALPHDFRLPPPQRQLVQALRDGGWVVQPDLAESLPAPTAPMA